MYENIRPPIIPAPSRSAQVCIMNTVYYINIETAQKKCRTKFHFSCFIFVEHTTAADKAVTSELPTPAADRTAVVQITPRRYEHNPCIES